MITPAMKRERGRGRVAHQVRLGIASRAVLALALAAAFGLGLASPALGVPDDVRIPMLQPREEGDPPDSALFSHWGHKRTPCYGCHPSVFPQARLGFDHEAMDEGRFCGSCHEGKTAKAIDDMECEDCHVPTH